jgi:diguanylate cyclase (GGDEF)-like protein
MVRSVDESERAVDDALRELREAIRARVAAEQLRDNLTGLASDIALTEWIEENAEEGSDFWSAFIEVDRFKSINDRYGYQDADEFLKELARILAEVAGNRRELQCVAFRAHGDEFYLTGLVPPAQRDGALRELLDDVRERIANISIHIETSEPLRGTVSIGWLRSRGMRLAEMDVTERGVRACLEAAVAKAKRLGRNCLVEYDRSLHEAEYLEGRQDCGSCGCKFTVQVDRGACQHVDLYCPNCGERAQRPPSLRPPG